MNLSWLKDNIRRIAPKAFELRPIRVAAPPCAKCDYWMPRVSGPGAESLTNSGTGYRMCWSARGIRHDFSCFNKRVEPKDPSLFEDLDTLPDEPSNCRSYGVGSGTLPGGGFIVG